MSQEQEQGAGYWVGTFLHVIGYVAVFAFTGTCTFLFFQQYAPARASWLPFLGLALCEYGCYKWFHYAKHNAENMGQLLVAITIGGAAVLGIATCTGLELASWFGLAISEIWKQASYIYIIVLSIVQILGFIGVGIVSNKNIVRWRSLGLVKPHTIQTKEEPSNKFEDMLNTGPMLPAVNGNGQIKKKGNPVGGTQTN